MSDSATDAFLLGCNYRAVAYSTFILAKQAGFDLEFRYAGQMLPYAPVYLLPGIRGMEILFRRHWLALLERMQHLRGSEQLYLDLAYLEPEICRLRDMVHKSFMKPMIKKHS